MNHTNIKPAGVTFTTPDSLYGWLRTIFFSEEDYICVEVKVSSFTQFIPLKKVERGYKLLYMVKTPILFESENVANLFIEERRLFEL